MRKSIIISHVHNHLPAHFYIYFLRMKQILDGSVHDAEETINSGALDMTTVKACYLSIKRYIFLSVKWNDIPKCN